MTIFVFYLLFIVPTSIYGIVFLWVKTISAEKRRARREAIEQRAEECKLLKW